MYNKILLVAAPALLLAGGISAGVVLNQAGVKIGYAAPTIYSVILGEDTEATSSEGGLTEYTVMTDNGNELFFETNGTRSEDGATLTLKPGEYLSNPYRGGVTNFNQITGIQEFCVLDDSYEYISTLGVYGSYREDLSLEDPVWFSIDELDGMYSLGKDGYYGFLYSPSYLKIINETASNIVISMFEVEYSCELGDAPEGSAANQAVSAL